MSDHTIIDTSTMTEKNKFTFKGLTSTQKAGIVGGGLALTAAMTSAISSLIGSTPDSHEEVILESDLETMESVSEIIEEVNPVEEIYEPTGTIAEESHDFTFDSEVQFSNSVHDGMSFEEAFATARTDVGTGGWFDWHSQSYSTFTREEWDSMSGEEQEAFVSEVVANSSINSGEWTETTTPEDDAIDMTETQIEVEEAELFVESPQANIETAELENNAQDEPTASIESEQEDLSEDIIIVKPIRGADINEDGVVDAIVFDNDGDGNIDLVALDEDNDGTFESFMINEDGDEDLDVFIIDEGGDGIDGDDSMEEISDVVNMEDFVVLSEEEVPEDLSFIDDIFGDTEEDITDADDVDLGLDDIGL